MTDETGPDVSAVLAHGGTAMTDTMTEEQARAAVVRRIWHPHNGTPSNCGITLLANGGVSAGPITRDNCHCGAFAALDALTAIIEERVRRDTLQEALDEMICPCDEQEDAHLAVRRVYFQIDALLAREAKAREEAQ